MSLRVLTLFILGILCWTVSVVADDDTVPTQEQLTFFETKIRPVLIASCYECHASDAKIIQGGLRLDSRAGLLKGGDTGAAIVAGNPDGSLLIQALRYSDIEMPPKGKLPDSIIKDFETWVTFGAPDPRVDVGQPAA
jgi:hypothetical protein